MKQKESHLKGDWYRIIINDFKFIEKEMNEDNIKNTPKEVYRGYIYNKIRKGPFQYYMKRKEKSKKKMKNLNYISLNIQPYLIKEYFSFEEKKLLFSLRSQCYNAKLNFRKLNRNNLRCSLKCDTEESQAHIFQSCEPILNKLGIQNVPNIIHIYGTPVVGSALLHCFEHPTNALSLKHNCPLISQQLIVLFQTRLNHFPNKIESSCLNFNYMY